MALLPLSQFSARQIVITVGVGIVGIALGMIASPLILSSNVSAGTFPWGALLGFTGMMAGVGGLVYGLKATENSEKLSQEVGYVYQRLSAMEKYQSEQHSALQTTIQGSLHEFLENNQAHSLSNPEIIAEINTKVQSSVQEALQKSLPENVFLALQNGLSDVTSEMGMVATLVQDLAMSVSEHDQSLQSITNHSENMSGQISALQIFAQKLENDLKDEFANRAVATNTHADDNRTVVTSKPKSTDEIFAETEVFTKTMSPTAQILRDALENAPQETIIRQIPKNVEKPKIDEAIALAQDQELSRTSLEEIVREQVAKMLAQKKPLQPVEKAIDQRVQTSIERALSAPLLEEHTTLHERVVTPLPKLATAAAATSVASGSQLELLAREALKEAQERLNQERVKQEQEQAQQLENAILAQKEALQARVQVPTASPKPINTTQSSPVLTVTQHNHAVLDRAATNAAMNIATKPVENLVENTVLEEQKAQILHNPAPVVPATVVPAPVVNQNTHNIVEIPKTASQETIATALREDKIELHLQPIMQLPQRKAYFYETLTRLRINDDLILPTQFLPVVSEKGQAASFDTRVAERVMVVARHLAARGSDALVSMNISAETLADGTYLKSLDRLIAENGTVRNRIVLEVGQGTIRSLSAERLIALKGLSHRGIKLCIDRVNDARIDAQTLAQIGISFVKMPIAFLVGREPSRFEIAPQDLPAMFKRNGITLIAERVETEEQVRELLDLDITLAQGHVFAPAKPIRSDVFTTQFAQKQKVEEKSQLESALDTALSDSERQSLRTFLSRSGK